MALTISTGFVVDDAIVVIENITRYLEQGMTPLEAALEGSREIGFTVLSMSTSLIAVFIPILLMGGIVGRMFREFAITLSVAVAISMVVSLTTTPMMCAKLLKAHAESARSTIASTAPASADSSGFTKATPAACAGCCDHQPFVLASRRGHRLPGRLSLHHRSQGLFPAAGHRTLERQSPRLPRTFPFKSMQQKLDQYVAIVQSDPAVDVVAGFIGGRPILPASISL